MFVYVRSKWRKMRGCMMGGGRKKLSGVWERMEGRLGGYRSMRIESKGRSRERGEDQEKFCH